MKYYILIPLTILALVCAILILRRAIRNFREVDDYYYELPQKEILQLYKNCYEMLMKYFSQQQSKSIKFTPAGILSWIQDGHAVAPCAQKDLLNYLIDFVNHFTILSEQFPSEDNPEDKQTAEEFLKDNLSDNLWMFICTYPVAYKADEMLKDWIINAMQEYRQAGRREESLKAKSILTKFVKYADKSPHLLLTDVLNEYLKLNKE